MLEIFENAKLIYWNYNTNSFHPTDFYKKSNGVYLNKDGNICFTKDQCRRFTEDNEDYTKEELLDWFRQQLVKPVKNAKSLYKRYFKGLTKYDYIVITPDKFLVYKQYNSKKEVKAKASKKYKVLAVKRIVRSLND